MPRIASSLHYRSGLADTAALVAGMILPLAYAPAGWYPLAVVVLAALFALTLDGGPGRAFWRGWLFGIGAFGVGVSWVYVSIHDFGQAPAPLAAGITIVFVIVLALFPGAAAAVGAYGRIPSRAWRLLAVLPSAWLVLEWIRGWLFTGFPWLNLGDSQTDGPLAGLVPVLGGYGASLAVAFSAAALVWAVRGAGLSRVLAPVAAAALWIGAGALTGVSWTEPTGRALSVSLIQGNIAQDIKWRPEQLIPTLEIYAELTEERLGRDVVVWPETAIPAFRHQVAEDFLNPLGERAADRGTALLTGLAVMDDRDEYYNSIVHLGPEEGRYDKRHLVPFGEYVPLRFLLTPIAGAMEMPLSDFSAGAATQPPIEVHGVPMGAFICYEAAYARHVARALPHAQALLNVSNDAWFGDSLAPHQHLQIARMRALETGRYLLRATNTGISSVIGPDGRLTARSGQFTREAVDAEVRAMSGATPFVRLGQVPALALAVIALIAAATLGRFRLKPPGRDNTP